MSTKVLLAPHRYVQGPDVLTHIAGHLAVFGLGNPLILADPRALGAVEGSIKGSLDRKGMRYRLTDFRGECTWAEIHRIRDEVL